MLLFIDESTNSFRCSMRRSLWVVHRVGFCCPRILGDNMSVLVIIMLTKVFFPVWLSTHQESLKAHLLFSFSAPSSFGLPAQVTSAKNDADL